MSGNVEEILKHPIVIIVLLAGVGLSNIINIKLASDPHARPDPFTGTEGAALEERIRDLEEWKHNHVKWGREQHGRHEANIQELYRRLP